MNFTMHRDRVVTSKYGRSFAFKKGEPLHVPEMCYEEVMAAGGAPEDDLPDETPEGPVVPQGADRTKAIADAMKGMILKANREDFMASGMPKVPSLVAVLGFPVDAKERDSIWASIQSTED